MKSNPSVNRQASNVVTLQPPPIEQVTFVEKINEKANQLQADDVSVPSTVIGNIYLMDPEVRHTAIIRSFSSEDMLPKTFVRRRVF